MKRSARLKRSVGVRRVSLKRAGSSKDVRRELDRLARELCLRRAGHRCERCGARERLQWHHVYSRRYLSLRWEPLNLVMLCAGCHLFWHHNPLDAAKWFVEKFGTARQDALALLRQTRKRQDLGALMLWLRVELAGAPKGP